MTSPAPGRRSGELTLREMARWSWRQLTSMRTALILLLLLALAAIPGSVIPQSDVDSLKTSRWQDAHPTLTPIYERLGLFSVYDAPWFAAIYLLLMVSLVGCIIPRSFVYWSAMRARPPQAPRRLDRLPHHASYTTDEGVDAVLARASTVLRKRRFRVDTTASTVAAERGFLREAGNLVFHISVVVVLVGFAMGSLFGYKGGAIVVVGSGFANDVRSYDDFVPGSLFQQDWMEPFSFDITDFDVNWLTSGPRKGMAQKFVSHLTYQGSPDAREKEYDLRVNHPLSIGDTEVFLIGHGYAPVITITDGDGNVATGGPSVFLPTDQTFESFGVVAAPDAQPTQIGLEGQLYPTFAFAPGKDGGPYSAFGQALDPLLSMVAYTGDLGMDTGAGQSVYVLDKANAELVTKADGSMFRLDMRVGRHREAARWRRLGDVRGARALEQDPDQPYAGQAGRARRSQPRPARPAGLAVHPAAAGVDSCAARGRADTGRARWPRQERWRRRGRGARRHHGSDQGGRVSDQSWETLSNQAVAVVGAVYFLAFLCHLGQWASLRKVAADTEVTTGRTAMLGRLGVLLTGIAVAVHLVALVGRGMAADPNRVPWGNMYEFTLAGTFFVGLFYLALYRRFGLAWMAPLVTGFVLSVLMAAVIWLYDPVAPLTEALDSPWLVIHVVSAVIATGAFSLGGITSLLYLLKSRKKYVGRTTGYLARVPDLRGLDRIAYRLHAFAFPVWTFAVLITGPIWAHQAWSSYWNWDPKEVWAFITWVVYAAYLHARTTAGWRGRNAAILALVGVATLWFNFIGINFFSTTSQHSYAEGAAPISVTAQVESGSSL